MKPACRPALSSAACTALPSRRVLRRSLSCTGGAHIVCVSASPFAPLSVTVESKKPHAGGILEVLEVKGLGVDATHPPLEGATANKLQRRLRFWLPPGHDAAKGNYPVVCLNDGQNLFGDGQGSLSGLDWQAGKTASRLIEEGKIPPIVIASIDHSGSWRSFDYLPFPPGSGIGGLRKDAASWPGGGVLAYTTSVLQQVLPLAVSRYGCTTDPAHRVFGGSSFGGICSLWMAMLHPGGIVVESPSFWMANSKAYMDVLSYEGPWPDRVFLGMGSQEYGVNALDGRGPELNRHLTKTAEGLSARLKEQGLGPDRHMLVIGQGAGHNEGAWAARLPAALEFVCGSRQRKR